MESYSRFNVIAVLFASFGSLFCGYCLSVIVATLGQPTFYSSLHLEIDPTASDYSWTNTVISCANGLFFAGAFVGCLITGAISSKIGRVRVFQVGAIVGIVGGAIQTGAISPAMYLVARVLTGIATGQILAAVPVWASEIAPPHFRGVMAGMTGAFINVGYFFAQWIGFGCFWSPGTSFAWRFPNAVIILWATLLLGGTKIICESPRWLVAKGRDDEALEILCRLHQDPNDAQNSFAHQELVVIRQQIAEDQKRMREGGRWQIVTEKTYGKRLVLAVMTVVGSQNTGILVINNYNALLYRSLGLSVSQALLVGAGYNTWAMLANFLGAFISDRVGRRKLLLIGFTSNICMFIVATGLLGKYSETPTKTLAGLALTFLFLYVTCHGIGIDPIVWTVAAEVFPSHLRASGTAIAISAVTLTDLLWLQLAPTAAATIGWKYYLVFIALGIVHVVFFWFKLPETSGLALEDIDMLFGKQPASQEHDSLDNLEGEKRFGTHTAEVAA